MASDPAPVSPFWKNMPLMALASQALMLIWGRALNTNTNCDKKNNSTSNNNKNNSNNNNRHNDEKKKKQRTFGLVVL